MNYKKSLIVCIFALILFLTFSCTPNSNNSNNNGENGNGGNNNSGSDTNETIDGSDMFTNNDKKDTYDETSSIIIKIESNEISTSSTSVIVEGTTITIKEAGTYILSGELKDGQIIIEATKSDKIRLVLRNLSVNSSSSAALYVKKADKVFVTLDKNSSNTLSNSGTFVAIDENNIDAAIFSKEDITFNGSGELNVSTNYGHGIVSKDDLRIVNGTYKINVKKHGLVGKDAVKIAGGNFNIVSGKDGIHSENADDEKLGYTYIEGGTFVIVSEGDGIDCGYILQINGGSFDVTSTLKGLKATNNINIVAGEFTISATDDAVHSNANIEIKGGTFTCKTKDDGFHADSTVTIIDGNITINESYEGLEGESVIIQGGTISIVSTDDGINASGGKDSSGFGGPGFGGPGQDRFNPSTSSTSSITISGGKVFIDAQGDGVDSNGNLYVSGGELYISGPTSNGDSPIDYDGTATITGGIVVAAGSKGMVQNFGNGSTQGSILMTYTTKTQGVINLYDSSGKLLVTYTPTKTYDSVVISCPNLIKGSNYKLVAGTQTSNITLSSLIYGQGGMGGGPGRP